MTSVMREPGGFQFIHACIVLTRFIPNLRTGFLDINNEAHNQPYAPQKTVCAPAPLSLDTW